MPPPLLILGADGQLGSSIARRLGEQAISWTREQVDLARFDLLADTLNRQFDTLPVAPATLLNCAAYTKVDLAEKEPELCHTINEVAVAVLARVCHQRQIRLVHFSTDYVFGSDAPHTIPYRETDAPSPQGVYARSKLAGEQAAATCTKHLVIRTCGLYGRLNKAGQGNFVETILRLARVKPELRIVNDQQCTPSAVEDVVTGVLSLLDAKQQARGLFHVVNSGATTWYDLAKELLRCEKIATPIIPITTAEFNVPAPRPQYSVLDTQKFQATTGTTLPTWQDALRNYLNQRSM